MVPDKKITKTFKQPSHTIARDLSWLSFNARVLQEAEDPGVPLKERIRFLGIFSNNLDEFFRVRVAALKRMIHYGQKARMHLEASPQKILDTIQATVIDQQRKFDLIWENIKLELENQRIHLVTEQDLSPVQKDFVQAYFEDDVRPNVIPLMIEDIEQFPYLREKSIYLAVVMSRSKGKPARNFALIEVPTKVLTRFVLLPSGKAGGHHIILLEDVIRFCLPRIFSFFSYDRFSAHVIKVTKDAEFDIDYDETTSYADKIAKAVKSRRKGKPVRFIYDREIDPVLLKYLIRRMNLSRKDHLIPGGRIHNFRQFMDFPSTVFGRVPDRRKPLNHPDLSGTTRVADVVLKKDIMLHPPYHSFNPIIDLLREAAMDPGVTAIMITAYRLASNSKVINAIINAARNGKQVTVVLELRARFDEEHNLEWKRILEEEGVKVLVGVQDLKVHAKLCLIRKKAGKKFLQYGFIGTGNLNEKTAGIYGDHFLLTSNRAVMADLNRIFRYLEKPSTKIRELKMCRTLLTSPLQMRKGITRMIDDEISHAMAGRKASITIKLNSLSDEQLIGSLHKAAMAGVRIRMIVRGICCMLTENDKYPIPIYAVSVVDQYLEHARVIAFHNNGDEKVWISSSDWMVRNLDHRVEAAVQITDPVIAGELMDLLEIQLRDNVKARKHDNRLQNEYVHRAGRKVRSQSETYLYLQRKTLALPKPGDG